MRRECLTPDEAPISEASGHRVRRSNYGLVLGRCDQYMVVFIYLVFNWCVDVCILLNNCGVRCDEWHDRVRILVICFRLISMVLKYHSLEKVKGPPSFEHRSLMGVAGPWY